MDADVILLVTLNSTAVGYFFQPVHQADKTGSFFLHWQVSQGLFQSRCINCSKTEVRGKLLSLHPTERDYGQWKV